MPPSCVSLFFHAPLDILVAKGYRRWCRDVICLRSCCPPWPLCVLGCRPVDLDQNLKGRRLTVEGGGCEETGRRRRRRREREDCFFSLRRVKLSETDTTATHNMLFGMSAAPFSLVYLSPSRPAAAAADSATAAVCTPRHATPPHP